MRRATEPDIADSHENRGLFAWNRSFINSWLGIATRIPIIRGRK
jgi:hypothetical protein